MSLNYSEDLSVHGRIILDWILGQQGVKMWTGWIWLRIGTSGGRCEHGNTFGLHQRISW